MVIQAYIDEQGATQRWKIISIEPIGVGFGRSVAEILENRKFAPARKNGQRLRFGRGFLIHSRLSEDRINSA